MAERTPMSTLRGFLRMHAESDEREAEHSGISGFLLLPFLMLTAWSGGGLLAILRAIPDLTRLLGEGAVLNPFVPLRVLAGVAIVAYSLYCLTQFARKKRAAPMLLVGFFALLMAMSAAVAIWYPLHLYLFTGVLAAVSASMILYFLTSARVKNTFVR